MLDVRDASCTISGAPPSGTWNGLGYHARRRCRWWGIAPSIDRRYAIVDSVMLQEGSAKPALYSEGKVLGKVKAVTEATAP